MNLSLKKHRTNKGYAEFESWNETICRNQDHIKEIEHESLLLLHEQCIDTDRKIVNTNSTGKDSMVVNHLVKKSGIDCETYAMNMKMFGRDIEKFKCKKCLMKEFGWTQEQWNNQVNEFKNQGCRLF